MTRPCRGARHAAAAGVVALEAVLAAPLVAVLVVAVLGLGVVVTDQLVAERIARTVARAVAVTGAAPPAPDGLPPDGRVVVTRSGRTVTVEVTVDGAVVGLPYRVRAAATAALEPVVP